jgi:hypothetical protein
MTASGAVVAPPAARVRSQVTMGRRATNLSTTTDKPPPPPWCRCRVGGKWPPHPRSGGRDATNDPPRLDRPRLLHRPRRRSDALRKPRRHAGSSPLSSVSAASSHDLPRCLPRRGALSPIPLAVAAFGLRENVVSQMASARPRVPSDPLVPTRPPIPSAHSGSQAAGGRSTLASVSVAAVPKASRDLPPAGSGATHWQLRPQGS